MFQELAIDAKYRCFESEYWWASFLRFYFELDGHVWYLLSHTHTHTRVFELIWVQLHWLSFQFGLRVFTFDSVWTILWSGINWLSSLYQLHVGLIIPAIWGVKMGVYLFIFSNVLLVWFPEVTVNGNLCCCLIGCFVHIEIHEAAISIRSGRVWVQQTILESVSGYIYTIRVCHLLAVRQASGLLF